MQFRGDFLFFLGLVFGFSALRWGPHEWGFGFAHNLFVGLPLLVLGFRVRGLSRRCDEFEGILGNFRNLSRNRRSGLCLDGGVCALRRKGDFDEDKKEEDMVFKLRKVIERERKLREEALEELEKERKAASSAADEAMAKILRLQDEKALIEREARQYREIAEQKQMYDQQVIESLQGVVSWLEATMDEVLSYESPQIILSSRKRKCVEN
uniref:GTD-binding domain-containing protein n=1 Tax=Ananas comosus var. bracteatus TaxID=296719 RepID=A0A6V7P344_ANACO|nr:unnamed protein product [Ananas comosus var. bracteatus]